MKANVICANIAAVTMLGGAVVAPLAASAQNSLDQTSHHRQQTKNQWRNIGIGAGALSLFGLVKHDNTLAFAGAAGALYSASRYEHDRKSQARVDQARASYFSRPSFTRDGHKYVRQDVYRNGKHYYQFHRQ